MRKLIAGFAGFLLLGIVGTGIAQAASSVEDQLRQLHQEIKALRKEIAELTGARGGQTPVGSGQMPMGPMTPRMMQPMMQMMQACSQMMAQMGGMAPQSKAQSPEEREPTEHGTKQADGLEVTLISVPPLSPAEMQRMMPGMGGMGGMQGMGGMVRGMPGMGGMAGAEAPPTHWIGVIVSDLKDGRVVQGLHITLTAQKGEVTKTVTLMPMRGSYGANISLLEKARYTVTVTIARPDQPVHVAFEFDYE